MSARLQEILSAMSPMAIAVSGGVDSMTLAIFANRTVGTDRIRVMHAVSPAVTPEATERVRSWAEREGWTLRVLDAGEFQDENYRANPINRCFFCKTSLYGAMAGLTARRLVSGTNVDDLGEYRPGLEAAKDHGVCHPYVEAGMGKADVRTLARALGLGDLAELPAAPCLSSRIETLLPIEPADLAVIHRIESLLARELAPRTVRCRFRRSAVVVELDTASLEGIDDERRERLAAEIAGVLPMPQARLPLRFEPYRNGSAFVRRK